MQKTLFILLSLFIPSFAVVQIPLVYENSMFFINVILGSSNQTLYLAVDTSIPYSLVASPNCQNCIGTRYNPDASTTKEQKEIVNYTKIYNFYNGSYFIDNYRFNLQSYNQTIKKFDFISFTNVTLKKEFSFPGFFSFSFCNQKVSEDLKVFALYLGDNPFMDINEVNTEIVKNQSNLMEYPVKCEEGKWYVEPDRLQFFNYTYNSSTEEPFKLILDTTSWNLNIPSDFFYQHMTEFLPDTKCQVQLDGHFLCECTENTQFPTFNFTFSNGHYIQITPKDYIQYDQTVTGKYCYVYLTINYENKFWEAGISVLNNYYSIFNLEKKTLGFYKMTSSITGSNHYLMTFIIVLCASLFFLFGGHALYNKYVMNRENNQSRGRPQMNIAL